jgi:hypothetical protein
MDYPRCHGKCQWDIYEIQRILQRQEEYINDNRTSILSLTTSTHNHEHQCNSQNLWVMDTLMQHKRQIQALEFECSYLRTTINNILKGSQSVALNHKNLGSTPREFKEEDTVYQLFEDMELENPGSQ